jgi:small GTP-binding protein
MQKYDYLIKAIVLGFHNSGKTSLLLRYVDGKFIPNYNPIGIDFKIKLVDIEGKILKVQLWDTISYGRLTDITTTFYKRISAALIMFDITSNESFKYADKFLNEIKMYAPSSMHTILLGSKCDLMQLRAVTFEEASAKAKQYNMQYFEISSLTGENVEQAFHSLLVGVAHSTEVTPISSQELKKKESPKIAGISHKLGSYCS